MVGRLALNQEMGVRILLSQSGAIRVRFVAGSSNGRTGAFEAQDRGSNPFPATWVLIASASPLRDRLMVGRLTLNQEMGVRILLSQSGNTEGQADSWRRQRS